MIQKLTQIEFDEYRKDQARNNFARMVKFTKPNYEFNWHHKILARKLDQFAKKQIKRLIITLPPRHGKSEQTSRRLPAYILGINPDAQIMFGTYSADFASRMNRDVQRIMESESYKQLYPHSRIPTSGLDYGEFRAPVRNNSMFEIVGLNGPRGSYKCAGVGGAFTGMGADFFVIDDPIKNQKEADSPTLLKTIWEWFGSVVETRLEKNAGVLITMTRWHPLDLAGRLEQLMRDDPEADKWDILRLPGLYEDPDVDGRFAPHPEDPRELGDALWPAKKSLEEFDQMKKIMGSKAFNSLIQQRPSAQEGTVIKRNWFQYWNVMPEFDQIIQSWDCAFEKTDTSSYVVGSVWGRKGADFYLLDLVRDRMDLPDTIVAVRAMTGKWPKALTKLVEKKANGPAVIQILKSKIPGLIAVEPEGSKESRFNAISPLFEAKNVWIPSPEKFLWVKDYIEELVTFPASPDNDQVDVTSQALLRLRGAHAAEFSAEFLPDQNMGEAYGGSQW